MPNWKKIITSGSDATLNSLNVTNGITGSLYGSSSYALTASYALNGGGGGSTDTGSLLTTASVSLNTITFTKGDGSTFPITVDTGSSSGFIVENAATYRVITANNSATTGSAQENLIFSGSVLRITGSIETTGAIISNGINVVDNAIAMAIALG